MEQAESNPDSLRVFTTERWFVQLGMAARGIACCSKCDLGIFRLEIASMVKIVQEFRRSLSSASPLRRPHDIWLPRHASQAPAYRGAQHRARAPRPSG